MCNTHFYCVQLCFLVRVSFQTVQIPLEGDVFCHLTPESDACRAHANPSVPGAHACARPAQHLSATCVSRLPALWAQALGKHAQGMLTQLRLRQVLLVWSTWAVRARQLRLAAGWLAPVVRWGRSTCPCIGLWGVACAHLMVWQAVAGSAGALGLQHLPLLVLRARL